MVDLRRPRLPYRAAKRLVDVVGAGLGLAVGAPVVAAAALAIKAEGDGSPFFVQERPGRDGQVFRIVKLRTMRPPKYPGEPDAERLTPLGKALRAASIDEIPQLWCVLRGDMSLVGPRPLLVRYLDRYTPDQARRHDVKPGITGWAQINGRNAISWGEKFALDTWYVDHASLALDLRILAATVARVVHREGISNAADATMPEFFGTQEKTP